MLGIRTSRRGISLNLRNTATGRVEDGEVATIVGEVTHATSIEKEGAARSGRRG